MAKKKNNTVVGVGVAVVVFTAADYFYTRNKAKNLETKNWGLFKTRPETTKIVGVSGDEFLIQEGAVLPFYKEFPPNKYVGAVQEAQVVETVFTP